MNDRLTPEMIEAFDLTADPYPDLPLMKPGDLRDGDVLMMLGKGWATVYEHHGRKYKLPVSWLIRVLDGGAYSHSATVSIVDGEPKVWDHSQDWELGPVSLHDGIKEHRWCHVYRMTKHGEGVGSHRYPAAPIVEVLEAHTGDPYDKALLLMAGVVAVISRMPEDAQLREALRLALEVVVAAINWLVDSKDIRAGMLVCTAVTGMSYWQARNEVAHDYALEADIQRRRQAEIADPKWDRTIADLKKALSRVWSDLPAELETYRQTLASNAHWVDIGGPLLPVNLVSPSDLEFSRTLTPPVGRLEIPK